MKGRILLVFPPYVRRALSGFPPLGMASLASYLLNKNPELNLKVVDFTVEDFSEERWARELRDFRPEVVGISTLTLNYPGSRVIARLTREFDPGILIVVGGVHATMRVEECLGFCDIVVRGEGEETFWEIVQDHEPDTIKGISFWKDGKVAHNDRREYIKNLDDLPFPAQNLFPMKKYREFPGWGVMGSRGCPYGCIFCLSPKMWERRTRFRSPKNIVDEIEHLHRRFGIERITFFDDTINIPSKRTFDLCDEIIRRNLHKEMSFVCQARANKQFVSLELFQKMREANFVTVSFGVESGSEKVLKSIGKSLTPDEARQAIKLARGAGIKEVTGFFMVGNWDETLWDVIKTWRFGLFNRVKLSFAICTPFPGTEFYELLKQNHLMNGEPDWGDFHMSVPSVRTNRMSRTVIFMVYTVSLLEALILNLVREGKLSPTIPGILNYGLELIRAVVKPFPRS